MADLSGALPRTPPWGFVPWTPTKGHRPLESMDFLKNGVKGATAPLRVQGRALAFLKSVYFSAYGAMPLAGSRAEPRCRHLPRDAERYAATLRTWPSG